MSIVHRKLVRDRIPSILESRQVPHQTRLAATDEMDDLLAAKLREEAAEVAAASTDEAALDELADVLEVAIALAERRGFAWADVVARRDVRRSLRGGFDRGVVLEWTDRDESDSARGEADPG